MGEYSWDGFDEASVNVSYSVALLRKRTIPIEQPLLVGELVSTFGDREVSRGHRGGSSSAITSILNTEAAIFSLE